MCAYTLTHACADAHTAARKHTHSLTHKHAHSLTHTHTCPCTWVHTQTCLHMWVHSQTFWHSCSRARDIAREVAILLACSEQRTRTLAHTNRLVLSSTQTGWHSPACKKCLHARHCMGHSATMCTMHCLHTTQCLWTTETENVMSRFPAVFSSTILFEKMLSIITDGVYLSTILVGWIICGRNPNEHNKL